MGLFSDEEGLTAKYTNYAKGGHLFSQGRSKFDFLSGNRPYQSVCVAVPRYFGVWGLVGRSWARAAVAQAVAAVERNWCSP
jgi:hypothetical protein